MSSSRESKGRHQLGRNLTQDELRGVDGGTNEFHTPPAPVSAPQPSIGSPGLYPNHPFGVYGNIVLGGEHAASFGAPTGAPSTPTGAPFGSPFGHAPDAVGAPGAYVIPAMPGAFGAPSTGMPVGANGVGNSSSTTLGGYAPSAWGGEGSGIVTHSFDIRNWGDPHQNITIDGHETGQIDTAPDIHDFEVLHNTLGGATTISTQTTNQDQSHVHESFNREVDMSNGAWGLQAVANGDGQLGAVIHDAQGAHVLAIGQSVREADGTVISNDGHSIVVNQALRDGGHADTSISLNGANYIDMETSGEGNAGLGGWAAEHYAADHQVQTETYVAAGTGIAGLGARRY